ncbi:heterodisulfide reductase-related iron-sulfur binding cluster [Desulfobotulus sp. H1]|uniref:Heterodisulfide reductase-related iron-sulfur binding cluster n=1 Tax=Desulfobotulus pelophilus TaxID=2823377 RepID=A0ABT3NAQ1_9BACT|nr:heterodisulfide reductase-related iron-sulfur binding cluster [Desulfobotulus pelophilus]MCW7754539.1 heterodisulfide reductase-related iron-sulfur binding cluster [Desulfobotulus pelophilus]
MEKNENAPVPEGYVPHPRVYYYPGCSLMSTARDLGESLFQMARLVGSWLEELKDWNCCGASPAHSVNQNYAILLAGRNLVLAERQGIKDLFVICPSCFVRLRTAAKTLMADEDKNALLEEAVGKRYQGSVRLRFFLEVGSASQMNVFRQAVVNPLKGLKGVLYFGCLLTRPEWITGFDVLPYEDELRSFVESMGVETLDWGYGKQCCGAHLALTKPDHVDSLVDRIRDHARRVGANCMISFCPLCQVNMELRGKNSEPLPVFYVSELIGMACRLPRTEKWIRKHLVDPRKLLAEHNLL